jgi:hypothetical protein
VSDPFLLFSASPCPWLIYHTRQDNSAANPICVIDVGPTMGRQVTTGVKTDCINCVWEKIYSFDYMQMTKEQFEHEKLGFKIYDKNHFLRNQVIGSYECSLNFIYKCKNREVYRTWVPLTRPDSPIKEWGYILFSAYVLKKGDPVPHHNLDDDRAILEDNLVAPDIVRKGYMLNCYFYKAQDIPIPEEQCNTFVNVRFNGMTAQTNIVYNSRVPKYNTKVSLPYYAPLRSDPIEVQLWNHNLAIPDTFVGSQIFSASAVQLKAIGPLWVNFFSSPNSTATSTFYKDGKNMSFREGDDLPYEYVGRMMMRLVVVPTERNPQLKVTPCEPLVTEPPQSMYRLRFALYSASEIPIHGGFLRVCVKFGDKERYSPWVIGQEGKFHWMKQVRPICILVPDDLNAQHDVVITLQHRVGLSQETISYIRVPTKRLLLGYKGVGNLSKNWVINGTTSFLILFSATLCLFLLLCFFLSLCTPSHSSLFFFLRVHVQQAT